MLEGLINHDDSNHLDSVCWPKFSLHLVWYYAKTGRFVLPS